MTKGVQNPWSFFKIERPPFWTSFLPVSSIKGMPAAMLLRHCEQVPRSGQDCVELLGLWLRSSLTLLNPCETVRSHRKTMFTRDKMCAEGEIHQSWCICECCANWKGQQEKECLCCKEIEEAVNKISGE